MTCSERRIEVGHRLITDHCLEVTAHFVTCIVITACSGPKQWTCRVPKYSVSEFLKCVSEFLKCVSESLESMTKVTILQIHWI